ncbi:polyvinylalcohol dehydrogenase-like [Vitis riparia]|uniref:polyvinylalcohol dehydrogenase-like n=1 Tax=Vitis riparia TaxID=96939 RepID=UPI00155A4AC3|nr:polyvinylalcohol dehydrogenase-like [Vitis riparia]
MHHTLTHVTQLDVCPPRRRRGPRRRRVLPPSAPSQPIHTETWQIAQIDSTEMSLYHRRPQRKRKTPSCVNAFNGALVWRRHLGELTGLSPTGIVVNVTVSRTTPAVADDLIVIVIYGPAVVVAVNRLKGTLVWSTVLDPRPRSQITMSGTPYSGDFYVGVSSLEEALPPEQCCTFRGSMAKLDIGTGEVLWRTYMIPDNGGQIGGYSGAALWGRSPAIDIKRGLVYIGTGNLYSAPAEVLECQARRNNQTTPSQPDQCIDDPNVHFDSILALELDTGKIRWFCRFEEYDVNYFACLVPNNPACPPGPNLDADFGEAPMLLTIFSNGTKRDVVFAVQKSGYAWALDRDSGDIVWWLDQVVWKEEECGVQLQTEKGCTQI